jgi:ribose transport system ATP-binding protein
LRPGLIKLSAYLLASLLAIVAGILLLPQVGIGLNTAGVTYSISSISAAVVGGATLSGGRGSFISAFLGAAVVEQSLTAAAFLGLGVAAPLYFLGGLILLAAIANMRRSDSSTMGRLRQLNEKLVGGQSVE